MDNRISDAGADSGDSRNSDAFLIASLQSELELLRKKIKELENENARLSSMVSNCCCQKTEEGDGVNVGDEISSVEIEEGLKLKSEKKKKKKKKKKCKDRVSGYNTRILREHSKRYVALKVMYFGQRFYGFASEAQMDPTVESEIFKAPLKTSLIFGDKKSVQYSRCGRTDKGFSSVGQTMEIAGKEFIGEHDFRNFCKMDAVNVHNYRLYITSFEIFPCNERLDGDQIWVIKIRGGAFLWHQVWCMVAVLFLIGKGLESPDVMDALLDIERTRRKPQYKMAPEIPLV